MIEQQIDTSEIEAGLTVTEAKNRLRYTMALLLVQIIDAHLEAGYFYRDVNGHYLFTFDQVMLAIHEGRWPTEEENSSPSSSPLWGAGGGGEAEINRSTQQPETPVYFLPRHVIPRSAFGPAARGGAR